MKQNILKSKLFLYHIINELELTNCPKCSKVILPELMNRIKNECYWCSDFSYFDDEGNLHFYKKPRLKIISGYSRIKNGS